MDTKLVWGAVLVPIGHSEIFGGMWDSNQLHWTRAAAVAEIEEHVIKRACCRWNGAAAIYRAVIF